MPPEGRREFGFKYTWLAWLKVAGPVILLGLLLPSLLWVLVAVYETITTGGLAAIWHVLFIVLGALGIISAVRGALGHIAEEIARIRDLLRQGIVVDRAGITLVNASTRRWRHMWSEIDGLSVVTAFGLLRPPSVAVRVNGRPRMLPLHLENPDGFIRHVRSQAGLTQRRGWLWATRYHRHDEWPDPPGAASS